jgi:hypothetical protein
MAHIIHKCKECPFLKTGSVTPGQQAARDRLLARVELDPTIVTEVETELAGIFPLKRQSVCDRIWPAKPIEDVEKQPGWCPLSEDDPMST